MRVPETATVHRLGILCLVLCWGFFPVCTFAQSVSMPALSASPNSAVPVSKDTVLPLSDSFHLLQEVKVQTAILPQVLSSIDPVQIVTRALPQWQDGLSVSDMVRYFSGVQLKDYGGVGGLKTINIRSLGTRHTAVLLDGLPLENAQNGQVDLGRYSLTDLGRISLYKNQNSQIFQSATAFASSNAIYLETRTDLLDSIRPRLGNISLQNGSFGLFKAEAYGATKWGKHWQLQGSVAALRTKGDYSYNYTNGVYDTTLKRDNGDVKRFQGKIGLYGTFDDSSALSIVAYGFRRQMGLPGAIVSNKFSNRERQDESDYFLQTAFLKPIGQRDKLKLQFKYNRSYLRYSNPDINKLYINGTDTLLGALTNHYKQASYFFSAANMYQLAKGWDVDLSADLHYDHLQMDLNGAANPSRWTGFAALASYFETGRVQLAGNILYTTISDRQQIHKNEISQNKLSPSVSASWQPFSTNAIKLRAFYKRSFQMPTFNDLYLTQYNQTELRPENSEQYNLGLYYFKSWPGILRNLLLETDIYYNEVKDKIVAIPTTSLFRWQMTNLGLARIKGLDFTAKLSWVAGAWNLLSAFQYTYQDARDFTDPGGITYKNILPYIPKHSGSFTLSANHAHFGLQYSFIYDGERYSERFNSLVSYVPAWYTHDVALNYHWTLRQGKVCTLFLSMDNLFNQHYDIIENYPMPGRNFKTGIQLAL